MDIKKHLETIKKQREQAKALSLLRVMQRSGLYPHACEKNKQKALEAIELIKNADCESDVLDATAVKEEVDWFHLSELKDDWNDYYGDAQKYLP